MTEQDHLRPTIGATPLTSGDWKFAVWAPHHEKVDLHLLDAETAFHKMERNAMGYHTATVAGVPTGARYLLRLDGELERPDPASRFQPEGVHGPSQVVDLRAFSWTDAGWKGFALEDSVFYELHVGAFTREGAFASLTSRLDELAELGVNTLELMPIAQFPGTRNWGYDGAYPYAVQNSYGSPRDLQALVDAAHARGLAVALDVVYNHLGPEGNYLADFGPYFTDHYRTPWGAALNFDGAYSDEVRQFFIQNALYWLENFHIDALRLDAIHGIFDASAVPFLAELATEVAALSSRVGRKLHLIAESDLNDARTMRPTGDGGIGMDAQWSDDFHHSVHTLLTGEKSGYYEDFGELCHLTTTLKRGWCYAGNYSRHRRRKHGNAPPKTSASRFVVCAQNHDQVGNRAIGDRLSRLVPFESLKLAAGITLLSSFTPLLFMGEEYGETAPFQYFTSHGDRELGEAVRRGRNEEFRAFGWKGELPDPQAESTFQASKLNRALANEEPHHTLQRFYQRLLRLRRDWDIGRLAQISVTPLESAKALAVVYGRHSPELAMLFHFGDANTHMVPRFASGTWEKRVDSADLEWLGPGACAPSTLDTGATAEITMPPRSFSVFERTRSSSE
jgi:maltooligosyltrehalose trehalohydrolase